jgi:hypothetical protein
VKLFNADGAEITGFFTASAANAFLFDNKMRCFFRTNNSTCWAFFRADGTPGTFFDIDAEYPQVGASAGRTNPFVNMGFVLITEPAQRAKNRIWSRLAEAAERCFFNDPAQLFQLHNTFEPVKGIVPIPVLRAFGDAFKDFEHPACAFAAGDAFSATFTLDEIHEEFGYVDHAGIFIHYHQAAGAHHGADFQQ